MIIETERLLITDLTLDMAEQVHLNSLDEDTVVLFQIRCSIP